MKSFDVDTDSKANIDSSLPMPVIDVNQYVPVMPTIPTGAGGAPTGGVVAAPGGTEMGPPSDIPTGAGSPSSGTIPSTSTPPAGEAGAPSNATANATSCAQFNGIPSCSYVGDPQGATLCNQCKAAGF
jgi:hypothetical protein